MGTSAWGRWIEAHPEPCSGALSPASAASMSWHCPGPVLEVPEHPGVEPPISISSHWVGARLNLLSPGPSSRQTPSHPSPCCPGL